MQDLIKQEQFELEVLDRLNTARILPRLVFCGGTMLRLCHGLNRFSVDLDFWLAKDTITDKLFNEIRDCLDGYRFKDKADKYHTILFEIRSPHYPRSLKLEIRKELKQVRTEQSIAYSPFCSSQVLLTTVQLDDMFDNKLDTLISRKEIRDAFDLEFLVKKGITPGPGTKRRKAIRIIQSFTKTDYTVKLGSLLEPGERGYYKTEKFKILLNALSDT